MKAKHFSIFGLTIASDIPLGQPTTLTVVPDLTITSGNVAIAPPADMVRLKPCIARSENALWYRIPGLIRAQTDSSGTIFWEPEKNIPEELVVELLMDAVIPEILQQSGYLVRYGFAVCNDNHALLIVNSNHITQSEVCTLLSAAGLKLLSDGLSAARQHEDGLWYQYPGLPRSRHWDLKLSLLPLPQHARRVREEVAVYADFDQEKLATIPKLLKAIVFIEEAAIGTQQPIIEPISRRNSLKYMQDGVYTLRTDNDKIARVQDFRQWIELSTSIHFISLKLPSNTTATTMTNNLQEVLACPL